MAIEDADLQELLTLPDRGRQAWIDGELGFGPGLDATPWSSASITSRSERPDAAVSRCQSKWRP